MKRDAWIFSIAAFLSGSFSIVVGYGAVPDLIYYFRTNFDTFYISGGLNKILFLIFPLSISIYFCIQAYRAIYDKKSGSENSFPRNIAIMTIIIFSFLWVWGVLLVVTYPA